MRATGAPQEFLTLTIQESTSRGACNTLQHTLQHGLVESEDAPLEAHIDRGALIEESASRDQLIEALDQLIEALSTSPCCNVCCSVLQAPLEVIS